MLKKSAEMPPYWVFMPYLMERMIKGTVVMGGACMWVGQVFPTNSKHYGKFVTAPTTSVGGGRFPDMEDNSMQVSRGIFFCDASS